MLRIFGPKRDEIRGDWRKLHNEELHNFYSMPNITRMFKRRRMLWTGYVERMGIRGMHTGFLLVSQKERRLTTKTKTVCERIKLN
jgi:hypothetical protein